jgi:hypothetical protein
LNNTVTCWGLNIFAQAEPPEGWPSGFRGEDLNKLANQKQDLPVVAMFVNGLGQNEQSLERIFYRCFLRSFSSFG